MEGAMNPNSTRFEMAMTRRLHLAWRAAPVWIATLAGCASSAEAPGPGAIESVGEDHAALANYARSIQSVYSGKCFHAQSLSTGARVQQSTCNGGSNQQFVVETHPYIPGDNHWRIRNTAANLCVKSTDYWGYGDPELSLVLGACDPFYVDHATSFSKEGASTIPNGERTGFWQPYNMCAHVPNVTNGQQILGRSCNGANTQRFEVRIDAPPPPPPSPPPCASGQRCCEPEGSGCALCVPSGAQCP
jgi:hypothetical protein